MSTVEEKNHDTSTTIGDHYDTVSDPDGAISVIAGAALDSSTYGVRADFDAGTNGFYIADSLTFSSDELTLRVLIKFDNLTNSSGSQVIMTTNLRDSSPVTFLFQLVITYNTSSTIVAKAGYRSDGLGTTSYTAEYSVPTTGEVCFEIRAVKETADGNADGILKFYIDGSLQETITNADNFNNFNNIDQVYTYFTSSLPNLGGSLDFDEWILDDSSAASLGCSSAAANEFRLLGLAVDRERIWVTGAKDSVLKVYDYDLATLTETAGDSFGGITNTEIDNDTRGIYPLARPGADNILYVYGRDGNNKHLQYNDLNGVAGWQDIGDGGWGSAKIIMACLVDPLDPDDLIAAFDDDDIYRSEDNGAIWVKMGDAPASLVRVGARHPVRMNEIILAAATPALYFSHNFGVSFDTLANPGGIGAYYVVIHSDVGG